MSSLQRFEAQVRLMQESARSLAALALTGSGASLAGSALHDADILMRRKEVKGEFICAKKAARELLLEMLPSERAPREAKLLSVQAELRAADARLKALDLSAMEPTVGDDAAACATGAAKFPFPSAPRTNDEYLDSALDIVASTTAQLKDGLQTLISIKIEAVHAAATVESNHEKIEQIDKSLDGLESELCIARRLLSTFGKRLYTDKVLLALTFLIVVAIVGISIYAALNPKKNLFSAAPAVATPPLSPASSGAAL